MKRILNTAIYIAGLGAMSHFVGEALPRHWFNPQRFPFAPFSFEKDGRLYRFLRVHAWKDKLPDMSRVSPDMVDKRISLTGSSAEAARVAVETCVAEVIHVLLMLGALPVRRILPGWPGIAVMLAYALSNLPFIIIQRYNRPTLVRLAERLKQREERIHAHSDIVR